MKERIYEGAKGSIVELIDGLRVNLYDEEGRLWVLFFPGIYESPESGMSALLLGIADKAMQEREE